MVFSIFALSLNAVSAEETSDATVIEDVHDSSVDSVDSVDSIDSIDTTSNSNNLATVQFDNANVDISQNVKSSDYNIDENINKNLENSYDDLEEVADKNKNLIGASIDDKEILRGVGSVTLVDSGDGYVYLKWTGVSSISSETEVTIYRNNGVYGTTTWGTVSSSGVQVNLTSGSNTIYFKAFYIVWEYTSEEYITTYGGGSGGSGGSGNDPIDDPVQLPDYYIRLFDYDEYGSDPDEIWKGVQYYSGNSANFTFVVEMFRADGGTDFNSVAYQYNSYNTVHLYIDGSDVTSGNSYSLWRNGTSYNSYYHPIGITISGTGVHKLYATFEGRDGVTYYSNPYFVYMGQSSGSEYDTTLRLYDAENPSNSTVYRDVGYTVTIYDLLTASGVSNVTDYVNSRHASGTDSYILENLDVYLNGEIIYNHTETTNYTQYGEGVRVGTADVPHNGFTYTLDEVGWYNFTAVYYGNNLGLKNTTSDVLHIYAGSSLIQTATTTTVSVVSPTISIGGSTVVNIAVDAGGNTITAGDVEVYIDGVAVQNINGRSYTFTVPYSNTAKTYEITAKYLGATVGNVFYDESTSNSATVTVKDGLVITVTANPIYYGDQAVVNIQVNDSNGPVSGLTLSIVSPSGTESITTDSNGLIVYTITDVLNVDTYTITASYSGGGSYESTSGQGNLIVNKLGTVIESSDLTVYAYSGENVVLYLKDSKGHSLGGKAVSIQLSNNGVQNLNTNASGAVSIPINMAKGTYTLSASFADETNYNSSFATFTVKVKPNPTIIEVSNLTYSRSANKSLLATLKDGKGNAVSGKTLKFYINGKVYSGTSGANGQVSIPVTLNVKKTYQVLVRYDGDDNYEKSYNNFNLRVTS